MGIYWIPCVIIQYYLHFIFLFILFSLGHQELFQAGSCVLSIAPCPLFKAFPYFLAPKGCSRLRNEANFKNYNSVSYEKIKISHWTCHAVDHQPFRSLVLLIKDLPYVTIRKPQKVMSPSFFSPPPNIKPWKLPRRVWNVTFQSHNNTCHLISFQQMCKCSPS